MPSRAPFPEQLTHAHHTRHLQLPLTAGFGYSSRTTQPGHRTERQWEIESLQGIKAPRRYCPRGAGPEFISPAMRRGDRAIQGTRRMQPVSLRLGFASDEYGYLIDMGLPKPGSSAF